MKISQNILCLALLVGLVSSQSEDGHCIWYGLCGEDPMTEKPLNCYYTGKAKPVPPSHIKILKDLCPELVSSSGDAATCCDSDQIESLQANVALPQNLLQNCPACWSNFRKYLCQMVCSPIQSNHIFPQKIGGNPGEAKRPLLEIEYLVTNSFTEGLFKSCANVYSHAMGIYAMEVLCGGYSKEDCTGQRLLSFLGNPDNGQAPFPINMTYVDESTVAEHGQEFHPVNVQTTACNEPVEGEGPACTCSDCPKAC